MTLEVSDNEVVMVWKIPDSVDIKSNYEEFGIFPSGELMSVCEDYEAAKNSIEYLEEHSPSERFGKYEDDTKNDMKDAPYTFITSVQNIETVKGIADVE